MRALIKQTAMMKTERGPSPPPPWAEVAPRFSGADFGVAPQFSGVDFRVAPRPHQAWESTEADWPHMRQPSIRFLEQDSSVLTCPAGCGILLMSPISLAQHERETCPVKCGGKPMGGKMTYVAVKFE
jgi:hypothetical protein